MLIADMYSINMTPTLAAGKPHVVFVTGDEELTISIRPVTQSDELKLDENTHTDIDLKV